MSTEVLQGNTSYFHPFIHDSKPHTGQWACARLIKELLTGSDLATSYSDIVARRERLNRRGFMTLQQPIEDKSSLRGVPHINGILRDPLDCSVLDRSRGQFGKRQHAVRCQSR